MLRWLSIPAAAFAACLAGSCAQRTESEDAPELRIVQEGSAPGVRYTIRTDRGELALGETLRLVIDFELDEGEPLPSPSGINPFEPWNVRTSDLEDSGTRTYVLEPFLPGDPVPAIGFVRGIGEAAPVWFTTEPIEVTVTSAVEGDEADLAGIKELVDPLPPSRVPLFIAAGVTLALLLAGAALALRARAQRARLVILRRAAAHEVALSRIDALLAAPLLERGRVEAFVDDVSRILRTYIEDRFDLHAPERTTEEFLREARTSPLIRAEDIGLLEHFLTQSDFVKFAGAGADADQCRAGAETVRAFIQRTGDPGRMVRLDEDEAAGVRGVVVERIDPQRNGRRAVTAASRGGV